jgi:Na+(H+)/acetate symporter ActP
MDVSYSAWLVIVLAVLAANLPFFNERLFAVIPLRRPVKPFWMRLLELAVLYVLIGVIAFALESRIGNTFDQTWEFYWVNGFVFVVLAFPGFVQRYLRKRRE